MFYCDATVIGLCSVISCAVTAGYTTDKQTNTKTDRPTDLTDRQTNRTTDRQEIEEKIQVFFFGFRSINLKTKLRWGLIE